MIRHLVRLVAIFIATSFCEAHAATTINVTTTAMVRAADGQCSLVEAFLAMEIEATVDECVVGPGKGPYTIVLGTNQVYTATSTDPIYGDLYFGPSLFFPVAFLDFEIIGNGSVIERAPGAPKFRFFFIENGTMTLRNLTLRGGDMLGEPTAYAAYGGAILVERGIVNLDRVTLEGNSASVGGAVFVDLPPGTLNALSSTFIGGVSGGTVAAARGGILNVANSTFTLGPHVSTDVFMAEDSTVSLSHNTFAGSVYTHDSYRGALVARGNVFGSCSLVGTPGRPLIIGEGQSPPTMTGSHNVGPAPCPGVVSNDTSSLQPLADNGGPTRTRGFATPSPLLDADPVCTFVSTGANPLPPFINAANPLFTNGAAITTDQRGVARTAGACDIGAFETSIRLASPLPSAEQGLPYATTLTGTGGTGPYTFSLVSGPEWASVTNLGPTYSLRGIPPSGHGTTVDVVLRIVDANGFASYGTYPLFIGSGLPGAPTLTGSGVDPATGVVTVTFDPPADDGGSPVSSYKVVCASPPYASVESPASPLVFSVAPGTIYTGCAVHAINGGGQGPGSADTFSMSSSFAVVTGMTKANADIQGLEQRVRFNVTFNRDVTNLFGDDFSIAAGGGVTGALVLGVLGSGKSYQVEVYTGTGFGTLGLNFVDRDTVFDSSFTSVGGAGAGNGDFTGPSFYTIAIPPGAPTITGLFPGDSVITALYTAPASNGGLPITGYEATCNPGASTSARSPFLEATVPVINAQTYTCTVTAFNGAGTGTPSAPMVVEVPAVAVTNLRRASPNPTLPGSTVEYTVTFSYPVTGVDTTDFVLTTSGLTGASIVSVAGFGSLYMVTVNTGSGVGTLRLDMVDDDSIRDATAPLYGMGTGPGSFGEAYRIHAPPGAPTITSITPGVGSAGIVFDSPASDGGSAITGYQATCTPGPVTSAVLPASSIAIALTAGSYTCTVVAINAAGPGGPSNSMGVTVSPPSVTGITTVGPMPTAAATIDFDVTFSVLVTGVDTTDFALVTTGGVTGAFVASVTGSGAAYRVTVNTGTGSGIGSIRLDLADDDSITDGASPLGGAGAGNGSAQGPAFAIDRTAPTVQSLVIVGGTPAGAVGAGTVLTYEITFTRDVTGVDASDFSTTLTSSATATVGAVTGGGSVYRVTFTVGGSGTMRVNVADDDSIADTLGNKLGGTGAGNGAYLSGPTVTVDGTAPVVSSINHAGPASIIAGSIAGFTVRFSKPVTGVNAADFRLVATGAAAGTVSVVTGSGDTYTVTISTTAGVGTLRLDLADDDSIEDAVGLKLGGTGAGNGDFQGQAYDLAAPERAATGASPTGTGTIAVTFTGAGLGDTCTLSNSQLLPPPPGADPVPPTTPGPGVAFPHGLVAFTLTGCTPGATVTVTITYPEPITGLVYWTFGPTADDATPHWYTLPATVAGNTVSFTITDGGLGDADLTVNGTIVDPSGIGSLPPPIPTLSPPMLLALLSLFLALGLRRLIGVRR